MKMEEEKTTSEYKKLSEEKIDFNSINLDSDISNDKPIKNRQLEIISEKNSERNSIRLLTYNIFCRPPPVHSDNGIIRTQEYKIF